MLSICLHLLWESEYARRPLYLRTRVSTFPKERAECRSRHPPTWLSASPISVSGQRLRPLTTTGTHRLCLSPLQSPPHHPHPTRNCLSCGHADSVQPRLKGRTQETLTGPEQVRPGEESGIIILIRDCTRQAVRRLSFGPAV